MKNAIECYKKSGDCYIQNNSQYIAAKQYEQVAFLANDMKDYQQVVDAIEKAVELMTTGGVRDSAGILLERSAK
jgi:hypothetical protein